MTMLLNKTIVVTGGASGIGLATARLALEEGANVAIIDHNSERLAQAAESLNTSRLLTIEADLRLDASHRAYVEQVLEHFGSLDGAVFNAGVGGLNTPLEEYPIAVFDAVLAINLRAVWLGLRAVIPPLKRQESGSIVMTSSIQGVSAYAGTTAYTTSKHALVGMMKGASLELAPHNVRVNTVHPGFVSTPLMDKIHHDAMPDNPLAVEDGLRKTVPMARYARAEEIARLMVFLLSDNASYSTGSCFNADGGILATLP